MKPYSHVINKSHTCSYTKVQKPSRWNCLAMTGHWNSPLHLQGQQGEPGPKGDPGPYGRKGEKVSLGDLSAWRFLHCVLFFKSSCASIREILEGSVNQEGLEGMELLVLRWVNTGVCQAAGIQVDEQGCIFNHLYYDREVQAPTAPTGT